MAKNTAYVITDNLSGGSIRYFNVDDNRFYMSFAFVTVLTSEMAARGIANRIKEEGTDNYLEPGHVSVKELRYELFDI